ncbi:MAG TPA: sigma-70 family RNA polymerase sigma factor [Acetobacteraceae bacterium]|nr:sigma-70 family RNA polymerase sigma factor [Acetobacteraceae bacterium]
MLHEAPYEDILSSDAILTQCGAWIYRAARRIRDRMPWADVDELVQQGIMVALEQRERYMPERGVPFLAFIKPRVFGAMIDLLRSAGTGSRVAASISELGEEDEESALEIIIRQEDMKTLAHAVDSLEMDERTAISLFYLEELTNKEVATAMAIDESKATRLRKRGIRRLAEMISTVSAAPVAKGT